VCTLLYGLNAISLCHLTINRHNYVEISITPLRNRFESSSSFQQVKTLDVKVCSYYLCLKAQIPFVRPPDENSSRELSAKSNVEVSWTQTYFRRASRVYDSSKSCSAVVYSNADSNEWILFLEYRHDYTRLYRVRKWRWSLNNITLTYHALKSGLSDRKCVLQICTCKCAVRFYENKIA